MNQHPLLHRFRQLSRRLGLTKPPQPSPVHAALTAAAQQVADAAKPVEPGNQALSDESVIVYDLETSGLNINTDSVLSIGAATIRGQAIALGNVFHEVLATPSAD